MKTKVNHRPPIITEEQIVDAVLKLPDHSAHEYAIALGETTRVTLRALERAEKEGKITRRKVSRVISLWSVV